MNNLTPSEETEFKRLTQKILQGEFALFVGAGASLGSDAPSGKKLVDLIKDEFFDIDFEEIGYNLLDICQEIKDSGRGEELKRFIRKKFTEPKPSAAHLKLPIYPWAAIFTTNYDNLIKESFEKYFDESGGVSKVCKPVIRGDNSIYLTKQDEVYLFKLMGDAKRDDPEECMVLTRGDFNNRPTSRRTMLDLLSNFAHQGRVLYVGYSFKDRIIFELID